MFKLSKLDKSKELHLFFDLEDTLVTANLAGWSSVELSSNMIQVNQLLDELEETVAELTTVKMHLFSFAMHFEKDRTDVNTILKNWLQERLNSSRTKIQLTWANEWFSSCLSDEIKDICCKEQGMVPSTVFFEDMSCFWGKNFAFQLFCKHIFNGMSKDVHAILFDELKLFGINLLRLLQKMVIVQF